MTKLKESLAAAADSGFRDGVEASMIFLVLSCEDMSYSERLMVHDLVNRLAELRYARIDYATVYNLDADFSEAQRARKELARSAAANAV